MSSQASESILPTETLELDSGLSLVPRVKLILTVNRSDTSVKPLDEWQLKRSLIEFLKTSFSVTVPEDDLLVRKFKDLKKRKRDDPVARGALFIRDLGFLSKQPRIGYGRDDGLKELEKKVSDWRKSVVDKMDGIELNLVGVKFKLSVAVPASDDFEGMKKEWEELIAFGDKGKVFLVYLVKWSCIFVVFIFVYELFDLVFVFIYISVCICENY